MRYIVDILKTLKVILLTIVCAPILLLAYIGIKSLDEDPNKKKMYYNKYSKYSNKYGDD